MRRWTACLLMALAVGCQGEATLSQDKDAAVQAAEDAAARILEGDLGEVSQADRDACAVLEAGILATDLGVDPSKVQYRPSGMSKVIKHALCLAWWDRPDKEELNAAYSQALIQHMTGPKEKRGGKPAIPKVTNELSLTILHPTYATNQESVASLERSVADLTKGIAFEVQGKERTAQVAFEPWIEGVGDRATWAPATSELHVAASGVRFTLGVRVYDDGAENRAKDLEMAPKIIDVL
jgi:hypothetical protein